MYLQIAMERTDSIAAYLLATFQAYRHKKEHAREILPPADFSIQLVCDCEHISHSLAEAYSNSRKSL